MQRDVDELVSDAILHLLKQHAITNYFQEHDITCPSCGTTIDKPDHLPTSTQQDTEKKEDAAIDDIDPEELDEAQKLLTEVASWSDDEIEQLPPPLRQQVEKYQQLYQKTT